MMDRDNGLEPLVRKLATHSSLSAHELEALLRLFHQPRALASHAKLFREDELARRCAVLLGGYAYRYRHLPDGGRQILNVLMPGDLIGLQRALLGHADHEVAMLSAGVVALLPVDELKVVLSNHPGLALALWSETLMEAAIQRAWTINLGRRNAHGRIAHLLCELAVRHEQTGLGERTSFHLPLTQHHIADCAGLTPVHVNRVFRSLRGDGLISSERRHLTIERWDELARVAGFDERYLRAEPVRP